MRNRCTPKTSAGNAFIAQTQRIATYTPVGTDDAFFAAIHFGWAEMVRMAITANPELITNGQARPMDAKHAAKSKTWMKMAIHRGRQGIGHQGNPHKVVHGEAADER